MAEHTVHEGSCTMVGAMADCGDVLIYDEKVNRTSNVEDAKSC